MNGYSSFGEWLWAQILKVLASFLLAGVTVGIANGGFGQSWNYWPVLVIWLLIIFIGFAFFQAKDGEISISSPFDW